MTPRRRRSRGGAAMVETLALLPVVTLLWVGYLYVHTLARHRQLTLEAARSASWTHAFDGCPHARGAEACGSPFGLELAATRESLVDDAADGLFGDWRTRTARAEFQRAPWLGGHTVRVTARPCLPCNPVPERSQGVVRRTYEDGNARVEP